MTRTASPKSAPWTSSTSVGRWSTLGPYYAMFPVDFARQTVEALCPAEGGVLDPFCGRGTVPYVAMVSGRPSLGIDLNPVAFVFSKAKTDPEPDVKALVRRIDDIAASSTPADCLPENDFQESAWCQRALGFLKSARRCLDWQNDRTDCTLMAILLVHLHGKAGNAISNQMRQTKGMSPDYAVRWWRERDMHPPEIDPAAYFAAKVQWRYARGVPTGNSTILLGDSRDVLPRQRAKFSLMLTSPPYYGVTNYRVDNWIRLWLLGDGPMPTWEQSQRYSHRERYVKMLDGVFGAAARRLEDDAIIYVRTDARQFTRDATVNSLKCLWPSRRILARHSRGNRSQTPHYGDQTEKPGEVDFVLFPESMTRRRCPKGFKPFRERISRRTESIVVDPI